MKTIALAGNPNCGKTTLFNALTGSTAHVGNWPGVTVDKQEGVYKKTKEPLAIIDLPGIYSLSPYTPEEVISRNYILDEKPSLVINVVDVTNLERNLYLTTQLLEIDVPVIIALNMMDVLEKTGDSIDPLLLERKLGVPVVCISAQREDNLDSLMDKVYNETLRTRQGQTVLENGPLSHLIKDVKAAFTGLKVEHPLFHAIKLIENDELEVKNHEPLLGIVDEFKKTYNDKIFGNDLEAVIADARYKYITDNCSIAHKKKHKADFLTKSDKADRVLTNKWASIPIFLVILFLVFHLTFSEDVLWLGKIIPSFGDWCSEEGNTFKSIFFGGGLNSPGVILANAVTSLTDWLAGLIASWLSSAPNWVSGFINDGVVSGVFAVLSFVPQIMVLFLFFSILEDSGYMARVAFILDRIFRKFGLSGRAFMPMIMGFGCSVPAMVNTRTLVDEKERTATIRVIPFFSCGAKLPILTAIAGAIVSYFGFGNADVITYSMYIVGMATAIIAVIAMRKTTMRGDVTPFIMELPAYHAPKFKVLMFHLWDKLKHCIQKAFTVILVSTIVIWFISSFRWDWHMVSEIVDAEGNFVCYNINESILASLGQLVQPLFTPLGFGSQLTSFGWVFAVAAVTGLIAKENVVATLGVLAATISVILNNTGLIIDGSLVGSIIEDESGISAVSQLIAATGITWQGLISFIVFNMTTIPCFAAVATAKAELPKKTLWITILFWVCVSLLVSTIIYLVLSWWWTVFIIALLATGVCFLIHYINKYLDAKKVANI